MATKSSKIHVYIFMVLIFFLCLLSFSVGTFVGKSVTESEMKKNQAEAYTSFDDRQIASIEEDTFDETDEISINDEEILSKEEIDALAEEFNSTSEAVATNQPKADDPNLDSAQKEETQVVEQKLAAPTENNPISETVERIAQDQPATKEFKEPRKPTAVMPKLAASFGKYTIQLASYTDKKEAKKHAEELKEKGYSAFYISANVKGKNWHRVSVGLFDDSRKANIFRKKFVKKTKLEAAIVQKITPQKL